MKSFWRDVSNGLLFAAAFGLVLLVGFMIGAVSVRLEQVKVDLQGTIKTLEADKAEKSK